MPKCLECGFEAPRLQWTHFKFKCTGRFSNGREYMAAHTGAKTVDEELAKRTAITEETLIRKYGSEEGTKRWEIYKQKQAHSNSLEYKQDKHGWTEAEYREYNLSRSITPETMVKKYGLEEGLHRYQIYCDKQKITKSKEYVIAKYGEARWIEINAKKAGINDPEYIANKFGLTLSEAVNYISKKEKLVGYSQIELEFIERLESIIGPISHTSIKSPFGLYSQDTKAFYVYDAKHGNCIIEFNGDYWHANPAKYNGDDLIRGRLATSIWEKDSNKVKLAVEQGYHVKTIWESDYVKNPQKIVEGVAEWIQNIQKSPK